MRLINMAVQNIVLPFDWLILNIMLPLGLCVVENDCFPKGNRRAADISCAQTWSVSFLYINLYSNTFHSLPILPIAALLLTYL